MPTESKAVTFTEFSRSWLATWAIVRLKASGYREYEAVVRLHLVPAFGELSLSEITPEAIQSWVASLISGGVAPATARNRLIVLKRVLETAVEYGLIPENPVDSVAFPRVERQEMKVLSRQEVRLLLDATPESWRLLLALPALCGLRKGECLALEWSDISGVDAGALTISVNKTMRSGRVTSPKTSSSRSIVPVPESLSPLIAQRRRRAGEHPLVFCRSDGRHLSDSTPNRILRQALEKAGLPHVRFHDLRHSWAVAHLKAGTDIKTLAHLGRWSSTQTLLDTYSHVIGIGGDAVRRFDEFMSTKDL
jgi:integrase